MYAHCRLQTAERLITDCNVGARFYLLSADEIPSEKWEKGAAAWYDSFPTDWARDAIHRRGEWRGIGPTIIFTPNVLFNYSHPQFVAVILHEAAHIAPKDGPKVGPGTQPESHGPAWVRGCLHLRHRAVQLGHQVDDERLLFGASADVETIRRRIGDEPARRMREPLGYIVGSDWPDARPVPTPKPKPAPAVPRPQSPPITRPAPVTPRPVPAKTYQSGSEAMADFRREQIEARISKLSKWVAKDPERRTRLAWELIMIDRDFNACEVRLV